METGDIIYTCMCIGRSSAAICNRIRIPAIMTPMCNRYINFVLYFQVMVQMVQLIK